MPSKHTQIVMRITNTGVRRALGIKLAWTFMEELNQLTNLSAENKIRILKLALAVLQKDVNTNMDYQVTRAVHHRQNLIQMFIHDMPQADVRRAIQYLPQLTGSSLSHESVTETVQATLQRPEGRQLATIRDDPFRRIPHGTQQPPLRFQKPASRRPPPRRRL